MEERSVVIKTRDREYLIVPKDQLTANSPKFKRFFDELKHDEHKIKDFSPEAVKTFIKLLEKKQLDNLEDKLFREIHKLAAVFEVKWLKESCRGWLKNKMVHSKYNEEDKRFLFDECWFMIDKWNDEAMMNELISEFIKSDHFTFLSSYLSDITKLETGQIDALLKLGGTHVEFFLQIILQNVAGQKHLDPNLKYLLQNFNLALCSEVYEELYLEVMDKISNLSEISVADLRFIHQLATKTARLVKSRKQERETKRSYVLWHKDKHGVLNENTKTLKDVLQAVSDNIVTSMFEVTELLLLVFCRGSPDIEEAEIFLKSLEDFCSSKKIHKVTPKFIDDIIAALISYSNMDQLDIVLILLNKIKSNKILCNYYENYCVYKLEEKLGYREKHLCLYFGLRHPLSGSCTQKDTLCGFILGYISESEEREESKVEEEEEEEEEEEDDEGEEEEEENQQLLFIRICTDVWEYRIWGSHLHDFVSTHDMYLSCKYAGKYEGVKINVEGRYGWWEECFPKIDYWKFKDLHMVYNVDDYLCKI